MLEVQLFFFLVNPRGVVVPGRIHNRVVVGSSESWGRPPILVFLVHAFLDGLDIAHRNFPLVQSEGGLGGLVDWQLVQVPHALDRLGNCMRLKGRLPGIHFLLLFLFHLLLYFLHAWVYMGSGWHRIRFLVGAFENI